MFWHIDRFYINKGMLKDNVPWSVSFSIWLYNNMPDTFTNAVLNAENTNAIQIKIRSEYQDMLPRPRLVCQEPGLRPIGRNPGVPDKKSTQGLGSMSRYSEQILICFIAYISFFQSSVGLVGNFAGLPVCTVPSAIVHCNQN